ncbi:MAG: triose-phosphate isomerase [Candidatus Nanosalina sp.]
MIIINFKAYEEAIGEKAAVMAEICSKVSGETGKKIIVSPQAEDILRTSEFDVDVFSQHIDHQETGSHTGHSIPEGVKSAGASGTLINHSERRIDPEKIRKSVERAGELGMTTVVCAQSPEEVEQFSSYGPDYIAFEPPELIGGDTAVSQAEPEMIEEAVRRTEEGVETLTGAGIKDSRDVEKSLELGCSGVLVASGVVKSEDPGESLRELCKGL